MMMDNRAPSAMETDGYEYHDYDGRLYGEYGHSNSGDYSHNNQDRRDKERSRDRERRRERRRREREKEDLRDRDYDAREGGGRDYGDRGGRDRYRDRPRESRFSDMDERERRGGSQDTDVYDYQHGEGFYEEGGYIDHPGHRDEDYPTRSRGRDYDRSERDREKPSERQHGGNSWMSDTPTHTILLRGLPQNVDEKDIKAELMLFGVPIKDVRLMRRKDTGASRGFAFVEFQNVTDAQRWMEHNQGRLTLHNQHRAYMYYSIPKTGRGPDPQSHDQRSDWTCTKCGYHNFKRRDHCFKCYFPREESDRAKEGDGFDQVGNNPCNTLIFRGLDALTTEENIVSALSQVAALTVKNTKVIRDPLTGTSRSFGFVEFGSLADSSQMLEVIQNMTTPLEIDGKAIMVSYAKNTYSTTIATMKVQNQCLWANQNSGSSQFEYDATTGYYYDTKSGQYYNPSTGQYYDYSQYYQLTQQKQAAGGTQTQTDTTNAAAAVAHAAIQQAQAAKQYNKKNGKDKETPATTATTTSSEWNAQSPDSSTGAVEYAKYPTPDVSTYQYDESSGYYYDPSTGLYYDANTQYYFNSTTNMFMYWDGEKQTYLPAPNQDCAVAPTNLGGGDKQAATGDKKDEGDKTKKDKDKKEKVKIAKKIAKDMEKWAKSMNAQKEAMKEGFKKTMGGGYQQEKKESAAADAGFAILEMVKVDRLNPFKKKDEKHAMPPPLSAMGGGGKPGDKPELVASYGGDSDDDDDDVSQIGANDEDKLLDWNKMACLLCKRQFPSKEALQRHQQLSDLHKTNLENFRKMKGPDSAVAYRDRAKERRQKYGKQEPTVPNAKGANIPPSR